MRRCRDPDDRRRIEQLLGEGPIKQYDTNPVGAGA
jgi:hypothetical protein